MLVLENNSNIVKCLASILIVIVKQKEFS